MKKSEVKEIAVEMLLSVLDHAGYKLADRGEYNQEERELIYAEMKKQERRIMKMFGYTTE